MFCCQPTKNALQPYCKAYCAPSSASLRSSCGILESRIQCSRFVAMPLTGASSSVTPDALMVARWKAVTSRAESSLQDESMRRLRTSLAPSNGHAGLPSGRAVLCFLPSSVCPAQRAKRMLSNFVTRLPCDELIIERLYSLNSSPMSGVSEAIAKGSTGEIMLITSCHRHSFRLLFPI